MSEANSKQTDANPSNPKDKVGFGSLLAFLSVFALIIGLGFGILQMRPKEAPTGRPIGGVDKVQAYALPATPAGEGFTIWRDGREIYKQPNEIALGFQRIELSSNDVDIVGNATPDLMLYGWTGGAHCCFTQFIVDGHTGRYLGQLELGNGDPMPFIPTSKPALPRAALVNFDDVTAYKFGSFADSPMARIVVSWNGKRFALDQNRMKSSAPDSPPTYYIDEPELGDAVPLRVEDYGEDEDKPAPSKNASADGAPRGDRAKTYTTWMGEEEARMQATKLNPADESSFGPMAAFLNERVYKGQAIAGIGRVREVYKQTPQDGEAALAYYFSVLKQSRWYGDLNQLNGGQLTAAFATVAGATHAAPK